jgi:methyl-accepting chemotaxis protein
MLKSKRTPAAGLGSSVMYKLLGIVGLCLLSTVIVAVIGVWQMGRIGQEIEAVAEQDMPLTEVVSRVTVHQLEQAVLLERILRLSGLVSETTPEELAAAEAEFERLSSIVDEEIGSGERLAEMKAARLKRLKWFAALKWK